MGISGSSVRRYSAAARTTPDAIAARVHYLSLIVGDLSGAYNEIGIRQWFDRKRAQLNGRAPSDLLIGRDGDVKAASHPTTLRTHLIGSIRRCVRRSPQAICPPDVMEGLAILKSVLFANHASLMLDG